jgi:hypothetical protein
MTMKEELDRAGPMVDRVNAAIRENPLAAGLIGAGIAWMLFGGAKGVGLMANVAKGAAGMAGSAAATAGNAAASGLSRAGSTAVAGLKEVASASGSVASIVPDMSIPDTDTVVESVSNAGSAVADRINSAAIAGRQYGAVIQSRLSENLERQPLLLGAIGLAIGAGIASTFAATAVESEMIGEHGTALREKLQGLTEDAKDRAKQVLSDVKHEADRQGLTPDAAMSAILEIGEKVKTVAGVGRDSVAQRFGEN